MVLYLISVKVAHHSQLKGQPDTKWRALLSVPDGVSPSWMLLYKSPLLKKVRLPSVEVATLLQINLFLDSMRYPFALIVISLIPCFAFSVNV